MTRKAGAATQRRPLPGTDLGGLEWLLRALADCTRLRILALLLDGERCVCEIRHALQVRQPQVSRHLACLRRAGLVEARRDGLWVHYGLRVPDDECRRALVALVENCVVRLPAGVRDRRRLQPPPACCARRTAAGDITSS
jgi:ArsR family transcriptional regulator